MNLEHDALLYGSDEQFVSTVVPFLRDGLERDEGVLVATNARNIDLLRGGLDADQHAVVFAPSDEVYASVHGAIRAYDTALDRFKRQGKARVRAIGEVPYTSGSSDAAWMRYEPIAHEVFTEAPLHVVCPYDIRRLPPALLEHATRTHPHLAADQGREANPGFAAPVELLRRLPRDTRAHPVGPPALLVHTVGDDGYLARRALTEILGRHLSADRCEEALVAIAEAMTNGVRHGAGSASAAVWTMPKELVCEVRNQGPKLDDPFAGYRPPARPSHDGMGLWIARQLADHVAIDNDDDGPVVTLRFDKPGS